MSNLYAHLALKQKDVWKGLIKPLRADLKTIGGGYNPGSSSQFLEKLPPAAIAVAIASQVTF